MSAVPSPVAPPRRGSPPLLEADRLSKRFGNFLALDDVSLRVEPGRVHALLGENGAGKSTLVKCIMGYLTPDAGRIRLGDREVLPKSPRHAQSLGIGMVYQHFTLVPNMTVRENLVLSRPRLPFVVDWATERAALASFLARMPFQVDLEAPVRSLSAGEKQKIEILKQLYLESRVVILDEPTSVLTPAEADHVLSMLHQMARAGEISVVLITHKFREVTQFADEVTVLRRGRKVGHGGVGDLTPSAMADMMMGGASKSSSLPPSARSSEHEAPADERDRGTDEGAIGHARVLIDDLHAEDDLGVPALRGVTLEVRSGEIVGVAAIAGNGQEELVEVLAGQRMKTAGTVTVSGAEYEPKRAIMRALNVRCLPEEPLRNACVPTMSVADNMALRVFDEPRYTAMGWLLSRKKIAQTATTLVGEYGIRAPSIHTPIGRLSGGNVQRAVLARELEGKVDVLIAANPCMGLDFAAVAEIHARIRAARDRGAAVLLVSADLDEILALATRILVMSEGRIVYEAPLEGAEPAVIGKYMAGHGAHVAPDERHASS